MRSVGNAVIYVINAVTVVRDVDVADEIIDGFEIVVAEKL